MADLTLHRFCYSQHMGTFGRLPLPDSGVTVFTVERPWLDNRPEVSCIPEGVYACKPRRYYRGGYDAIEVTDVEGRTHILFHKGNHYLNSKGCILPGMSLGGWKVGSQFLWTVSDSATAFGLLMDEFGGREFTLEIRRSEEMP